MKNYQSRQSQKRKKRKTYIWKKERQRLKDTQKNLGNMMTLHMLDEKRETKRRENLKGVGLILSAIMQWSSLSCEVNGWTQALHYIESGRQ